MLSKLSKSQIQSRIRETAKDSSRVIFTNHVRLRMKQRHISFDMVLEVLSKGILTRTPEPNADEGTLQCRMERYCAGRDIAAVVALSDEDRNLIVVTVMET